MSGALGTGAAEHNGRLLQAPSTSERGAGTHRPRAYRNVRPSIIDTPCLAGGPSGLGPGLRVVMPWHKHMPWHMPWHVPWHMPWHMLWHMPYAIAFAMTLLVTFAVLFIGVR